MNDMPTYASTTERVQTWLDGRDAAHPLQQPGEAQRAVGRHVGGGAAAARAGASDDDRVRLVVFSGAGEKAFVSGADISQFEDMRAAREAVKHYEAMAEAALTGIHDFPKPTLACIRGYCIGGGVNVAISCDIRIASTDSVFSIPAARLGLGYRYSAMKNLVDLVGPGAAKDLFFTARRIDAAEAKALGLVIAHLPRPTGWTRCWPSTPPRIADERAAHHQGRQGDHARDPQGLAELDMRAVRVADPRLLRERRLRRRPHGLHGEAQAGVHRPLATQRKAMQRCSPSGCR